MGLEIMDRGLWNLALPACFLAVTTVVITWLALRDSDPKDRPEIIRALAELFHRRK